MKSWFLASALVATFVATAAQPVFAAQNDAGDLGLGMTTGGDFTGKYWLDRDTAIDLGAGLGVNFTPGFSIPLSLRGGYLIHDYDLITLESGELPFYYGGGLEFGMGIGSPFSFGTNLYGAIGFDYLLKGAPLDIFVEANPRISLGITPSPFSMSLNFGGALGVRYYFGADSAQPVKQAPAAAAPVPTVEPAAETPKAEPEADKPAKAKKK